MQPVALIVGMGGIGQAAARALAAAEYQVVLLFHSATPASADSFLATLAGSGHTAHQWDAARGSGIRTILDPLPRLDLVLYTPGDRIMRSSIEETGTDLFRSQFETSVFAAFEVFAASIPLLKRSGGGLLLGVTTSFIEPGSETPRMAGYISAKFALRGLLRELAREGKPYGIRANALAPDLMQTGFSSDLPPRYFEFAAERDPRGRITTPEDVAQKILFLLSPEGESVTGASVSIAVDEMRPL